MYRITALAMLSLIIISSTSCKKEKEILDDASKDLSTLSYVTIGDYEDDRWNVAVSPYQYSLTILGSKMNNPFTVGNMQLAFGNLVNNEVLETTDFDIRTTHKYVRFLPADEEEYSILIDDNDDLEFFTTPLDYEIETQGDYYVDTTLPDSSFTWMYTVVPFDFVFPATIQYELLDDLYLPAQDPNNMVGGQLDPQIEDLVYLLEDEALMITGNMEPGQEKPGRGQQKTTSKWHPNGTLRFWDTRKNIQEPLEGVKVRTRNWFSIHTAYTDINGYFWIHHEYRNSVKHSIVLERHDFDIRNGTFGQATIKGPDQQAQWNHDIWVQDGLPWYWTTIFVAARDYYYRYQQFNINTPPRKSGLRPKYKISAMNKTASVSGVTKVAKRYFGLLSVMKIFLPHSMSDLLYGVTIHEIAHYSHWGGGPYFYNNCESRVAESYADGIEWVFATQRYGSYGDSNVITHVRDDDYQARILTDPKWQEYTPLVVDLIDNHNQGLSNPNWPNDPVNGYSIQQIEDALNSSVLTFSDWENELRNNYNNPTENSLHILFGNW